MSTAEVLKGPFQGTLFGAGETYVSAGVMPTDPPRTAVTKSALTQTFLSTFDPMLGWAVTIDSQLLPVDMFPLPRDGAVPVSAVPCVQFDARLVNPEGRVVATASTVWTIKGPMDWERGETNARLRLYDALGLPTRFDSNDEDADSGHSPVEDVTPIVPYVESTTDAAAADALADAAVEAEDQPEAEAAPAAEADPVPPTEPSPAEASETGKQARAQTRKAVSATKASPSRKKRERLPDDAPPPKALIDQIERLCKLRNVAVPTVATKAEANAFLRSLAGG